MNQQFVRLNFINKWNLVLQMKILRKNKFLEKINLCIDTLCNL